MPPGDRVDIRELARLSGFSTGTVSRALNGYRDVRAETRERIVRLALELGYTPAAAARNLVMQRSHVVGVLLETGAGHPDLEHPFFHEVLGGLKRRLGADGYDLLLFATEQPGNGYGPHSYVMRARHHNVAGVVLMGVPRDDPQLLALAASDLPCVGIDVDLTGPRCGSVMSDNVQGARLAVRHLHELGHRRIATITGMTETRPGADRLEGYRRETETLGIPEAEWRIAYGDFYAASGHEHTARLLAEPEPPTAVFAASDLMAFGALAAAAEAGVDVPGELSIVGFDDIQLAPHVRPALTTVRQDTAALGEAAGGLLLEELEESPDARAATRVLPVKLVRRGSTGPCRAVV
jgi:LacI family transcriptional regulator